MPEVKLTTIDCVIPLAINSEGKLEEQKIEMHLEEETLQRMWEPIREKTRYRLQLLHMLRGA